MVVEKIADELVSRAFRLIDRQLARDLTTYKEHVFPVWQEFQKLHDTYLASFKSYRDQLLEDPDLLRNGSPLLDQIQSDNNFSKHTRSSLKAMAAMGKAETLEHFYEMPVDDEGYEIENFSFAIRNYLLRARAGGDLVVEEIRDAHPDRFSADQRFRNRLIDDLRAIINEMWLRVLDPSASGPPLPPEQLENELLAVARGAGVPDDHPNWLGKLQQALAVRALDEIVDEMQSSFEEVLLRYESVKRAVGVV